MNQNKAVYKKRKTTLKKKAEELSILCGVPVGLVCYDHDGKLDTWPEDKNKVDEILKEFVRKQNLTLPSSLEEYAKIKNDNNQDLKIIKNKNLDNKKKAVNEVYNTWDERFDFLPEESLMEVLEVIERKEKNLEERIKVEGIGKKRKRTQISDDDELLTLRLGRYDHDGSSSCSVYGTIDKGSCSVQNGNSISSGLSHGIAKSAGDFGVPLGKSSNTVEAVPITMHPLPQKTLEYLLP